LERLQEVTVQLAQDKDALELRAVGLETDVQTLTKRNAELTDALAAAGQRGQAVDQLEAEQIKLAEQEAYIKTKNEQLVHSHQRVLLLTKADLKSSRAKLAECRAQLAEAQEAAKSDTTTTRLRNALDTNLRLTVCYVLLYLAMSYIILCHGTI
jgi:hypothetical protein